MKLGLFTALFSQISLEEVLLRIKPLGVEAAEWRSRWRPRSSAAGRVE
jgi:hypothetical protein